jgi:hypothetical protein
MKVMVISLLLIFILPAVLGASIDFSAPSSAQVNESFSVTLTSDENLQSDVKVYVKSGENDRISQTYNAGSWKSSFYYVPRVYPEQTRFDLRVLAQYDHAELCAKLRESESKKVGAEVCKPLTILENEQSKGEDLSSQGSTPQNQETNSQSQTATQKNVAESTPAPTASSSSAPKTKKTTSPESKAPIKTTTLATSTPEPALQVALAPEQETKLYLRSQKSQVIEVHEPYETGKALLLGLFPAIAFGVLVLILYRKI